MNRRDFLKLNSITALTWISRGITNKVSEKRHLRVGSFKADITLPLGSPWYPSYKPLDTIEHPLLAKGIVIEDEKKRYVLCSMDWCEIQNNSYYRLRQMIAKVAKTEADAVFISTIHQHTAPICNENVYEVFAQIENPPPFPAKEVFESSLQNIVQAVKKAVSSLEFCNAIEVGSAKVEKVASNRRILQPDGTCLTRYSSCKNPKLIEAPKGLIDPYLRTLSFQSKKGKPIARLHFYATHPQSFYGDARASYDFPGMAREQIEKEEGVPHIYFTGCAGDIAAGKYNNGTPQAREQLCQRLLAGMKKSVQSLQKDVITKIELKTIPMFFECRKDGKFSPEELENVLRDTTKEPRYRISSAMEISWQKRASTVPIPISAFHIGNVSILHLPGEPMIEFQLFAQKCVPDRTVLVCAYGDASPSYICTEEAFRQGGYEPSASSCPPSTEGKLKETIQQVLT